MEVMDNSKYPPAPSRFDTVYLWHGRNGSPDGSVLSLESVLQHAFYKVKFERPALPYRDPAVATESALLNLLVAERRNIKQKSLIVGLDIGGLLAAKLQEFSPHLDFHVLALMSPTWDQDVRLEEAHPNRAALYSSKDVHLTGRTDWERFSYGAFDLDMLAHHDVGLCKYAISYLIAAYMQGKDMLYETTHFYPTDQELLKPGTKQL